MRRLWVILLLLLASCATARTYPIGMPRSGAKRFVFHMDSVAKARGYKTWRGEEVLTIETQAGDELRYAPDGRGEELLLTVSVDEALSGQALENRQAQLRKLSDELEEAAKKEAETSKVFEP